MEGTQENPIASAAADHTLKEPAVSLGTVRGQADGALRRKVIIAG